MQSSSPSLSIIYNHIRQENKPFTISELSLLLNLDRRIVSRNLEILYNSGKLGMIQHGLKKKYFVPEFFRENLKGPHFSNIIFILNPDYTIYWVNQHFFDLSGVDQENVSGIHFDALQQLGFDTERILGYLSLLMPGETRIIEDVLEHDDMKFSYLFSLSNIPNRDGKQFFILTSEDITEKKRQEQAARNREEDLHTLIDNVGGFVFRLDIRTGQFEYGNQMFLQMTGYVPDECSIGSLCPIKSLILSEDRERVDAAIKESLRTGDHYEIEYRIRHLNGDIIHLYERGKPVYHESGTPVYRDGIIFDITERNRRIVELGQANEYHRTLIEVCTDVLMIIRPDGRITDVNAATEKITGYSWNQLMGTDFSRYFTEPQRAHTCFRRAFDQGTIRDFPLTLIHRDGHRIPVLYNASVLRNESGEKIGVYGAARDVSELQKKTEELSETKYFLEQILEVTPNIVYVYDILEHRNIYANHEAFELLGYTPEQFQAMGSEIFAMILHPDDAERVAAHHARFSSAKDGDVYTIEYRMKHSNGEWRWLLSWDVPFSRTDSGEVKQILGSTEDITDRKRMEEELCQSETRLHHALEGAGEGLWDLHLPTGTAFFSPQFYKILGYEPDEFPATFESWCSLLHPDENEAGISDSLRKIQKSRSGYEVEHRIRTREGDWCWIIVRGIATEWDTEGKVTRLIGTIADITQRRRAEEALRQANHQLNLLSGITRHKLSNKVTALKFLLFLVKNEVDISPVAEEFKRIESVINCIQAQIKFC